MTYFHRRTSTIIGAKAFHGPVRDGKAWGHLAMVVKRKGGACTPGQRAHTPHSGEKHNGGVAARRFERRTPAHTTHTSIFAFDSCLEPARL